MYVSLSLFQDERRLEGEGEMGSNRGQMSSARLVLTLIPEIWISLLTLPSCLPTILLRRPEFK